MEPQEPDFPEPDDLEDFLFDLQDRFRSSTTQNLVSIHDFKTKAKEGIEQMFARFNLIARPLENESPPAITENQITTHYVHHLSAILKPGPETAEIARFGTVDARFRTPTYGRGMPTT